MKKKKLFNMPMPGIKPPRYQLMACECNILTHFTNRDL